MCRIEAGDEVAAVEPLEAAHYFAASRGVVPEEILPLGLFLLGRGGSEHFLAGVGMDAGIVNLGGKGHGCGGEILHLLQMEIELLGFRRQLGHIHLATSGMA